MNGHADLIEGLKALGIYANASQVNEAINTLYPNGLNGVDSSSSLRAVFIHLTSKEKRQ